MPMTERERLTAVINGKTPDQPPFYLDLSHYYYHRFQKPWDLLNGYAQPETDLIDFNRKFKAGFYVPNQMIQYKVDYADGVSVSVKSVTVDGVPEIHWRYDTPKGSIERIRMWEQSSYSWAIKQWGVKTEDDLRVLGLAMAARRFAPLHDNYRAWDDYVGDMGIVYLTTGYSAMGYILNYWMGIENTIYACVDWEDTMHEVVDQINANNLECVKMLAGYPGPIAIMGDNFSSDYQPPAFFKEWSHAYYKEATDIFHNGGKKVAVHVDGKLRGAIRMIGDTGADIIDAVTPKPMGDYTPMQCRDEAGDKLILSGGVSPDLWYPNVPIELFEQGVMDWLALKARGPAFIAGAGDQVPPGAEERRIELMRELVEQHGKF